VTPAGNNSNAGLATKARLAMIERVLALHPDDAARIYREERVMRGLSAEVPEKNQGWKEMKDENAALKARLAELGQEV